MNDNNYNLPFDFCILFPSAFFWHFLEIVNLFKYIYIPAEKVNQFLLLLIIIII